MKIKVLLLSVVSAGWLLPLYLAGAAFKAYLQTELEPRIMGLQPTHSFPILYACQFWFTIAALWLAGVIVFWVVYAMRFGQKSR